MDGDTKHMKKELNDFTNFVKEQGVVGLAVGFILGGSVAKIVSSLVTDIVNPLLGLLMGGVGALNERYLMIGKAKIFWGGFIGNLVDFIVIAAVVYYGVKLLGLEKKTPKK